MQGGGNNAAFALTVTGASCSQQTNNSLRYDCTVTTDAASNAWINFAPDTTGGCDLLRTTSVSENSTTHSFTMFGMKPSEPYNWRAFAVPAGGGAQVQSTCRLDTPGALPADGPRFDQIVVTKTGTAQQIKAVATHYGCYESGVDDPHDGLVVFDADGEIVWFQNVADDLGFTGTTFQLEAVSHSKPEKTFLAVANHEIIVEYDMAGNLLTVLCRDDGTASGHCHETGYTPDGFFDEEVFVHHDVQRLGDEIVVLTARDVAVTDTDDCDADANTTETFPIIVDGLAAFDTSGTFPVQTVDYLLTDINGMVVDYSTYNCKPPVYWNGQLAGSDVLHTNAFWIDVADQWMFSLKVPSTVMSVDRELGSGTTNDIMWEAVGSLTTGDFSATAGGYDETFSDQHAVSWGPTGEFLIFDNGPGGGASTRGVAYDMDVGAMTLDVTGEYEMENAAGNPIMCPAGGSLFHTLGGHALATCPETNPAAPYAVINEFNGSNNVVWSLELECDSAPTNYDPAGIAFRGYANPW